MDLVWTLLTCSLLPRTGAIFVGLVIGCHSEMFQLSVAIWKTTLKFRGLRQWYYLFCSHICHLDGALSPRNSMSLFHSAWRWGLESEGSHAWLSLLVDLGGGCQPDTYRQPLHVAWVPRWAAPRVRRWKSHHLRSHADCFLCTPFMQTVPGSSPKSSCRVKSSSWWERGKVLQDIWDRKYCYSPSSGKMPSPKYNGFATSFDLIQHWNAEEERPRVNVAGKMWAFHCSGLGLLPFGSSHNLLSARWYLTPQWCTGMQYPSQCFNAPTAKPCLNGSWR